VNPHFPGHPNRGVGKWPKGGRNQPKCHPEALKNHKFILLKYTRCEFGRPKGVKTNLKGVAFSPPQTLRSLPPRRAAKFPAHAPKPTRTPDAFPGMP
jgi:hypothetical protein